jgi:hypothetical protein
MPAVSVRERRAMAIAEHHPEQLYARNRGLLKMSRQQLHDFASTPEKGLPARIGRAKKVGRAAAAISSFKAKHRRG